MREIRRRRRRRRRRRICAIMKSFAFYQESVKGTSVKIRRKMNKE
jgi:hypothetical protein